MKITVRVCVRVCVLVLARAAVSAMSPSAAPNSACLHTHHYFTVCGVGVLSLAIDGRHTLALHLKPVLAIAQPEPNFYSR